MKAIFSKIVSKSDIKPVLKKVLITEDTMVATDSYVLLDINQELLKDDIKEKLTLLKEKKMPIHIFPEDFTLSVKMLNVYPVEEKEDVFPSYQTLYPSDEILNKDYTSITLNPKNLMRILTAMASLDKKGQIGVEMYIPRTVEGIKRGMIIKRRDKKAIGIVMPLNFSK